MSNIPCPIHVNCPPQGSLDFDTPNANFSSEAPDQNLCFQEFFNSIIPPLGTCIGSNTGLGTASANTCDQALLAAYNNSNVDAVSSWNRGGCTGPGNPILPIPITPGLPGNPLIPPPPVKFAPVNPHPVFFNQQQSCTFTCPDGLPFVWSIAAGTVNALTLADANAEAFSLACSEANAHFMCLSSIPSSLCTGTVYNASITLTKGPLAAAPFSYAIIGGALPPGLLTAQSTDSLTFLISGTPTQTGTFAFMVQVTDANGNFMQKSYTLNVLGITNINSLQNPTAGRAYNAQLSGAGGTAPFTFTLPGGSLPTGLTLSSSGAISGTPSVHYSDGFSVPIQITDANGNNCTQTWNGTVLEPPGPDWTKLSYSAYQLNQGTPANTVSGSGAGPIGSGSLTLNSALANVKISPMAAAGVTYTGGQVTANIQLVISDWNNAADLMTLRVIHSVAGQIGGLGAITGPGTFNFNFTVPASVGASITIDDGSSGGDLALVQANQFAGSPIKLTFVYTIFNL